MPYIESKELAKDKIQVWYTTNLKGDNTANLDRSKPTVLLLHGMFLSSRFLAPQFNDQRLSGAFNLIAIDALSCGKTKNPVAPQHDLWSDAALIAICMEALKLPPCHIMANGMNWVATSLRFAILFKDRCLSLNLVSIPGEKDIDWCAKAYSDLLQMWSFAPDLETVEEACMEVAHFLFSDGILPKEQLDDVIGYWMQAWPPTRRTHLLDVAALISGRIPLVQSEYDMITQPVLLVMGESSVVHPVDMAQDLQSKLRNAKGGCKLQVIRGGTESLHITPAFSGFVNRYLLQFVSSLESEWEASGRPPAPPPTKKLSEVLKPALELVAELSGDPKIKKREAKSVWSYSRTPAEGVKGMEQFIGMFKKDEKSALNPLDKSGQPLRKFSERHDNQMFFSPTSGDSRYQSSMVVL